MTQIALQVEIIVDIPNSSIKASKKSQILFGVYRTTDFRCFASSNQLAISTQSEIEMAVLEYVKHNEASLP